jgi:hypothetical protein
VREFRKWQMDVESMILDGYMRHYLKKDPRSVRELAIQNSKLRRMISVASQKDAPRASGLGLLGGRSRKKVAKERGKRDKAIDLQHRKVRSLFHAFIVVEVKKLDPNGTAPDMSAHIAYVEKDLAAKVKSIMSDQMMLES